MKLSKLAGATSEIWQVFVQDSSSTTGAGLAGLAFNTGSLTAYYHRDTDTTATAITLVTMTVGTFTSSGFKEIDATNMPGWYQFCPPNAALASGAKSCGFHLKGAANMAPLPIEVQLTAVNPDSATAFVTSVATVTNLTNAPTAGDLTPTMKTSVRTQADAALTAVGIADVSDVADAVLDGTAADHDTAGSIGEKINDAASAGDPWSTNLPGAYVSGTAGKALSDTLSDISAVVSSIAALHNISTSDVLTQVAAALTATVADSVPTDGTRPSIAQGIYAIYQFLTERSVSDVTMTVKKPDGTTTLMTFTLNSATAPTSITRAS